MMKRCLTLAALTLLGIVSICSGQSGPNSVAKTTSKATSQSSPEKAVIDREKALWEIVKKKQVEEFRKYYVDNYMGVSSDGIRDINQEVEGVRIVELRSYSLADMKLVFPNKATAILTYKVTVQGSFQGQDFSGVYYCSSVWVDQRGTWLAVLHTEAKAP
jgi:hypothetical protein